MLGQVICDKDQAGKIERSMVADTAVLRTYVLEGKSVRNAYFARRAAKALWNQRVHLVAFPPDYAYQKTFWKRDMLPPDETALRHACADKIVLRKLLQMGKLPQSASVAIAADKQSVELTQMMSALACRVRYLTLAVPQGEKTAEYLRLRYGISVRLCKSDELLRGDLAVVWNGEEVRAQAPMLDLTDKAMSIGYAPSVQSQLPQDISRELLAALVQTNPKLAGQIEVCSIG